MQFHSFGGHLIILGPKIKIKSQVILQVLVLNNIIIWNLIARCIWKFDKCFKWT